MRGNRNDHKFIWYLMVVVYCLAVMGPGEITPSSPLINEFLGKMELRVAACSGWNCRNQKGSCEIAALSSMPLQTTTKNAAEPRRHVPQCSDPRHPHPGHHTVQLYLMWTDTRFREMPL